MYLIPLLVTRIMKPLNGFVNAVKNHIMAKKFYSKKIFDIIAECTAEML